MSREQIIFFGGQGATHTLPANGTGGWDGFETPVLTLLSEACHATFLEEALAARSSATPPPIWMEFKLPDSPGDLLVLDTEDGRNPILSGVSLCVNQLLSYLQHDPDIRVPDGSRIVGFCSGMLPAVVVACSASLQDYVRYARLAVRAAFWVGYRAAEMSFEWVGNESQSLPWAISVIGESVEELDQLVHSFNQNKANGQVRISGRFRRNIFSLVGPGHKLQQFRSDSRSERGVPSSVVSVYALYHAGDRGKRALARAMDDLSAQSTDFPRASDLRRPLWSCSDGQVLEASSTGPSLLEYTLSCILVDSADLLTTWTNITQGMGQSGQDLEVLVLGEGAKSLIKGAQKDVPAPSPAKVIELPRVTSKSPQALSGAYAVVGMSVNFPSGHGKDEFWRTLENGLNTLQEIPKTRFKVDEYQPGQGNHKSHREMKARHGNFLEKPWSFDHEFFNISPREAKAMDPQQKLLLQGAIHALDDAGYVPGSTASFGPATMGCYIGIATDDYVQNLQQDIDVYYTTGTLRAFLSGKISYALGWSGPSLVIDTACSSSLVSIALACRALAAGECSAVLAGGANVITSPDMYLGLSRAHFLSSTGQCKPFDIGADGYCRSEGCGLFVIKRLDAAIRENDRIYGVIRGSELNQSGNAASITHPHVETQQKLLRTLFARAGVNPASVTVVEAHGTGTQAGDGAEATSLATVFKDSAPSQPRYLTSIKGTIGHAEAASGAASLAKLLMMLKHSTIPPQVGLRNLNPKLRTLIDKNFRIATEKAQWNRKGEHPRRALLNNFGAAGSNAALLLEEYPEGQTLMGQERPAYNFILSARTENALKELISLHTDNLRQPDLQVAIQDICYTVSARRRRYTWTTSMVCRSVSHLLEQLQQGPDIHQTVSNASPPIVFVFSGQGSSYAGMGQGLLSSAPLFREKVDECERILARLGYSNILHTRNGQFTPESPSDLVLWPQVACFVLEYALASLWLAWGVQPALVVGHSLGEYAALVISGVLSLEDALGIVVGRAQLMVDLCAVGKTGMMVCDKGAPHIEQLIDENRLTALSVACDNTPSSCVVSGGGEELDDLQRVLKALGIRCKRLDVPLGFHSSALDPILEPLERMCQRIQFHAPRIPLGACPYGRCLQEQDCGPEYIVQQTRSKVRFTDLIHSIRHHESLGNSPVFIEMGPHAITVPMLKSTLQDTESLYLGSLTKGQGEWLTLSTCLHQISERGYPVRWREVFDGSGARLVDAPAYPFQTQDLYVPFTESKRETSSNTSREKPKTFNLLTGYRSEDTAEIPSRFESNLGHVSPYVLGHVVGKTPLCPASVYHGMVLEAVHWDERENAGHSLVVADITFSSPLVYTPEVQNNMILMAFEGDMPTVSRLGKATARQFIFTSQAHPGSGTSTERNALCTGWAYWESLESLKLEFARDSAYVQRQIRHLQAQQSTASVFRTKTLYSTVFPRVVSYSDLYQSIQEISVLEDRLEAYGRFRIPKESHSDGIVSPVFLDTLLHAAGYVANIHVAHTDACICTQVETSTLIYQEIARNSEFQLYCSLFDCYDGVLLGEAYAIAEDGTIIASVKGMHFKRLNLNSFQRHLAHSLHGSSGGQTEHPTLKAEASTRGTGDANLPQSHYQQTSPAAAQQTQPSRSLEETVTRSLAEVCQPLASNVHRETHLSNLGLDSMMQIELATSLQNQIPDLRLDMERISRLETVQQLVEYIEQESGSSVPSSGPTLTQTTLSALGEKLGQPNGIKATGPDLPMSDLAVPPQGYLTPQSSSTPRSGSEDSDDNTSQCEARIPLDQSLILLQKGAESQPPLILFHDGSGMIEHYKKIHDMVCTVFAVKNPILRETHWATSLSDMAQQYSLAIASAIASPVVLGGWSFGGVLAHGLLKSCMDGDTIYQAFS